LTRRPNGFRPGKSGYGPANQTDVRTALALIAVEPMTGIEPAYSAWEAICTGEWASGSELVEVVSVSAKLHSKAGLSDWLTVTGSND
jgi:hypothetical protein